MPDEDPTSPPGRPTVVYTDGACSGNPGPGGWAWAVPGGEYRSGSAARTTNQRMEITAALEAVLALPGPLEIVSDSTYVVNCFRDRWWEGWLARGWKNSQKRDVANRDLWEPLVAAYRQDPSRLRFRWVKGHGGDPMNDLVDRLAVQAAATQEARHGHGYPADLGPADLVRADATGRRQVAGAGKGSSADPAGGRDELAGGPGDAPGGHLLVVTGLRPPELGGYDPNPVAAGVRRELAEILGAKAALHPDLVVLTGLGLGAEQLGAEAARDARVPYLGILAFPDQDRPWPADARRRFAELCAGAKEVRTLQRAVPTTRQAAAGALSRRDAWLARHADEAIVIWDGADERVGRSLRSLQDHLGEEEVWVVEPR